MRTLRTIRTALALLPLLVGAAAAQQAAAPAWPGDTPRQQAPGPGGWPGEGPPQQAPQAPMMPAAPMSPMNAPQQEPPCIKEFVALRGEAQKKAEAIQAAGKRKATPIEACPLFNNFVAAEAKMVKFAESVASSCGIPPDAVSQLKKNHQQTVEVRARVCDAAAQMKNRPTGPSLGDALGASRAPDASNIKPGRGTFDTLTGTPLGGAR